MKGENGIFVYKDARIQTWLKLLLAIFWVTLGAVLFIFRAI